MKKWSQHSGWSIVSVVAVMLMGLVLTTACEGEAGQGATSGTVLTIAAASDLRFAMEELIDDFQSRRPSEKDRAEIRVTYGSSGNFFAQIAHRAPFDLYLSADVMYPQKLIEQEAALPESLFEYAIGRIVIWVPEGSPIDVEQERWDALKSPHTRRVAIANPDHAPYGQAAVAAMKNANIFDEVKDKFVVGENIAQTAQFIDSRGAEIGIIALALAVAPAMEGRGQYWEIPVDYFPTMVQGGVITKSARDVELAEEFRAYLLSDPGQSILEDYGFFLP